jgi:hypothetical protein
MDMGEDRVILRVVGQCTAAHCLDILQMDVAPDGGVGVLQLFACSDKLNVPHSGDEHRNESLPHLAGQAEFGQRCVEIVAVVEMDCKGSSHGEFGSAQGGNLFSGVSR